MSLRQLRLLSTVLSLAVATTPYRPVVEVHRDLTVSEGEELRLGGSYTSVPPRPSLLPQSPRSMKVRLRATPNLIKILVSVEDPVLCVLMNTIPTEGSASVLEALLSDVVTTNLEVCRNKTQRAVAANKHASKQPGGDLFIPLPLKQRLGCCTKVKFFQ